MFQPIDKEGEFDESQLTKELTLTAGQYQLQPGDLLRVRVFTNGGESILDPNGELRFGSPGGLGSVNPGTAPVGGSVSANAAPGGASSDELPNFLILPDGRVRLPLVGYVAVKGLTLTRVDSLLEQRYSQFYKEVFVTTRLANARVTVLGAPGKGPQVVTIDNDPASLLEVLAAAGGIGLEGRSTNIRIIRGSDPKTAQVRQIDLSTIDAMRQATLQVTANDVVYVEPVRRPLAEGLRDYGRVFALFTGLGAIIGVLFRFL